MVENNMPTQSPSSPRKYTKETYCPISTSHLSEPMRAALNRQIVKSGKFHRGYDREVNIGSRELPTLLLPFKRPRYIDLTTGLPQARVSKT